jgi:diaminopimelate epimerase
MQAHLNLRIDLVDVLSATSGRPNERHFQLVGRYVNELGNDPIVAVVIETGGGCTTATAAAAAAAAFVVIVVGGKEADSVPISDRKDLRIVAQCCYSERTSPEIISGISLSRLL